MFLEALRMRACALPLLILLPVGTQMGFNSYIPSAEIRGLLLRRRRLESSWIFRKRYSCKTNQQVSAPSDAEWSLGPCSEAFALRRV